MVIGKRYRVRYRLGAQRVDREMVAVCMGWSKFYTSYLFDLRPDAGTVSIKPDQLIGAPVMTDAPVKLPYKVHGAR
jgi:hypothetical protein